MKSRNENILKRALANAAAYLVSDGFCTMESVSNCRFKKYNQQICEKCVTEMMLFLGRKETETAEREGIHV